jgi:hypothetical protein
LHEHELDLARRIWTLPKSRTKNAMEHVVHLSEQSMAMLMRADKRGPQVAGRNSRKIS